MKSRQELGRDGELCARRYLEAKGYRFLRSNFYTRWGEIDLIMQDGSFLVFVEVKNYRTGFIDARHIINKRKKRHLYRSGDWYRVKSNYSGSYRFDLVIVNGISVSDHLEAISVL